MVEQTLTKTGMVVGTPRYMAPEQWSEQALDPRSDLFAAGAILFEMLSGQAAFPGNDLMQVYHAVMSAHPAALTGSAAVSASAPACWQTHAYSPTTEPTSSAEGAVKFR